MNGKDHDTEPRVAGLSPDSTWEPCHLGLNLPGLNFLPESNRVGDPYWRQMGGDLLKCGVSCRGPSRGRRAHSPSSPQPSLARRWHDSMGPRALCHPPPKPASDLSFRKVGERRALVGPNPLPAGEACSAGRASPAAPKAAVGSRAGTSASVPVLGPLLASPPLPAPPFRPSSVRLPPRPLPRSPALEWCLRPIRVVSDGGVCPEAFA